MIRAIGLRLRSGLKSPRIARKLGSRSCSAALRVLARGDLDLLEALVDKLLVLERLLEPIEDWFSRNDVELYRESLLLWRYQLCRLERRSPLRRKRPRLFPPWGRQRDALSLGQLDQRRLNDFFLQAEKIPDFPDG